MESTKQHKRRALARLSLPKGERTMSEETRDNLSCIGSVIGFFGGLLFGHEVIGMLVGFFFPCFIANLLNP